MDLHELLMLGPTQHSRAAAKCAAEYHRPSTPDIIPPILGIVFRWIQQAYDESPAANCVESRGKSPISGQVAVWDVTFSSAQSKSSMMLKSVAIDHGDIRPTSLRRRSTMCVRQE